MLKNVGRWAPLTGVVFAVLLFVGANVGGTGTPISLEAGLRHTTVMFRFFGFIPLLTIKVR